MSLTACTKRPIYLQCVQKYADAKPGKELKGMKSEEYEFYRKELEEQKKQIRNSFNFGGVALGERAVVSLGAKFKNHDSPTANQHHYKKL